MSAVIESWASVWGDAMWRASWQGGLFILTVWLLCALFPRMPIAARYGLWWLACLKLLVALFVISIALPVLPAPSPSGPPARNITALGSPSSTIMDSAESALGSTRSNSQARQTMADTPSGGIRLSLNSVLFISWLVGIALWLMIGTRQAWQLRRIVRSARSLDDTERGVDVRCLGIELGLSRPPMLAASPHASGPLVLGIAQPKVILPESLLHTLSREELDVLVAHEAAHIRRRDLWLAWVPTMAQTLFFFHPLAWLACREWTIAQEACCDAEALAITGANPGMYGDLLVRVGSHDRQAPLLPALGATTHYHSLRRRLLLIRAARAVLNASSGRLAFAACSLAALFLIPWRLTPRNPLPAASASQRSLAPRYTLEVLGTLGGDSTEAVALNDHGHVVGRARAEDGSLQAFLYRDGRTLRLPTLPSYLWTYATDISNGGIAVGVACTAEGRIGGHALRWDDPTSPPRIVAPELSDSMQVTTEGINELGHIILNAYPPTRHREAWMVEHGKAHLIGKGPTGSEVTDVNDHGVAAGFIGNRAGRTHAVLFSKGSAIDLGTLGGEMSDANAINNSGAIVGNAQLRAGYSRACLWLNGTTTDLGTLGGTESLARGVNEKLQVVGRATTTTGDPRAFVWSRSEGMLDLNAVTAPGIGFTLEEARDINERGQICGIGLLKGQTRAFLLTPIR